MNLRKRNVKIQSLSDLILNFRLSTANHKIESVTRERVRTTLKEYRTRKSNTEMAAHQLELINEVLELKNDFFRDQTRIREGAKLNRKLEKNIAQLRHRVSPCSSETDT